MRATKKRGTGQQKRTSCTKACSAEWMNLAHRTRPIRSATCYRERAYNAVYVSGPNAGVAVNVKRAGTNGDDPAPDILEDWLTETQVNTERGRNELAKGGNQSITTVEPLTDTKTTLGLIEPGMLVEVRDITGDWHGLCLATSITAKRSKVLQSVQLERHY